MKHRHFLRLIIVYLLYGIIGFVVIITFTSSATQNHQIKREAQSLVGEASVIASDYGYDYYKTQISLDEFQNHMAILSGYLSADIWITDRKGNLLINSEDATVSEKAMYKNYVTIKDFDTSDYFNLKNYQVGTFYNMYNHDVLSVFYPVTVDYEIKGYVIINKDISLITANADGYTNIAFFSLLIIFILGFLLVIFFTVGIYHPIMRINRTADKYVNGDFSEKIKVVHNDEIGYLANTLNYMAKELDTLEEDQRKFVSNVSHDFRSPLTSIKGYVEAMIDGTIPVEMQDKYLNIILFETNRLNKLTQSIIDLNQFGRHGGIRLDIADFDINQMIRTTILTFEGSCSKKGISFDLVLTGRELFVKADMTKVQQVIYNLIDNATKFSHNDSTIKIETNIKNEKVLVSVKDYGVGISPDNIKKIWDRFYKIDSSRGKDKKGTGLGLSIVKEIISAHDEHINVISTEGVGTEFIFTLPLSQKEK